MFTFLYMACPCHSQVECCRLIQSRIPHVKSSEPEPVLRQHAVRWCTEEGTQRGSLPIVIYFTSQSTEMEFMKVKFSCEFCSGLNLEISQTIGTVPYHDIAMYTYFLKLEIK
jgi:hypothetical protein